MNVSLLLIESQQDEVPFPLMFALHKPITSMGRHHECDICIPIPSVSRTHCQIERRPDGLFVRDLGSRNGTCHNHKRVDEARLTAGDTLTVGPTRFLIVVDGQTAPS